MKLTAQDFERLYETSMLWHEDFNQDPLRFDGLFKDGYEPEADKHAIFWFEDYAHCLMAQMYLEQIDADYVVVCDEAMAQWTIVSTYQANWAKVN
jgi:hypothetical protein